MSSAYAHLGVVGAGAWGTALAMLANRAGTRTTLFTRNEYVIESVTNSRINAAYLPDAFIDPAINITSNMAELSGCDAVLVSIPAQSLRTVIITISDLVSSQTPIILATKGIERGSLLLMSEVTQSIMPINPLAVISGPNFAGEAAAGLPTATALATHHAHVAEQAAYMLSGRYFRVYSNEDPIGTQMGGALKNVLAIACGIAIGRGLGENARAALITRGLAEIGRLARAKGGREETLMGLAGMGDAMLSCSSEKSRNYALGVTIGKGGVVKPPAPGRGTLQEGVATAESAFHLAQKMGVNMPIISAVYEVLHNGVPVDGAIEKLLERPAISE